MINDRFIVNKCPEDLVSFNFLNAMIYLFKFMFDIRFRKNINIFFYI